MYDLSNLAFYRMFNWWISKITITITIIMQGGMSKVIYDIGHFINLFYEEGLVEWRYCWRNITWYFLISHKQLLALMLEHSINKTHVWIRTRRFKTMWGVGREDHMEIKSFSSYGSKSMVVYPQWINDALL